MSIIYLLAQGYKKRLEFSSIVIDNLAHSLLLLDRAPLRVEGKMTDSAGNTLWTAPSDTGESLPEELSVDFCKDKLQELANVEFENSYSSSSADKNNTLSFICD